ncbi:MAG: hypothetical protein JW769_03215 [Parachlamydiales bacterium]|nr:hypothetical protein [Parachlamydiales bacterium]
MKTLIIGLKRSGQSAAKFLLKKGHEVIGFDDHIEIDPALDILQKEGLSLIQKPSWKEVDQVILSPGVFPMHPLVQEAKRRKIEVIGEVELALRYLNNSILGITGTNGKTTTTELTTFVLQCAQKKAIALGNIGRPMTSYLEVLDPQEILVVELSSFQLETMTTRGLDGGAIINLFPDHMDRYRDFSEYVQTKCRVQHCLKKDKKLYMTLDGFRKGRKFLSEKDIIFIDELEKKENMNENRAIAYSLCRDFGVSDDVFFEAAKNFIPPKHRLTFVASLKGINFINDSKATNPISTCFAIKNMSSPTLLLAGGLDKNLPFGVWNDFPSDKVKRIIAFGKSAQKIQKEVKEIEVEVVSSLRDATYKAWQYAKKGDTILLSPGCASFDSYKNYEHRGDDFVQIVQDLEEGEKDL